MTTSTPSPSDRAGSHGDDVVETMTPHQEYDFYADPANHEPQGSPVRRQAKMGTPIPVRFPDDLLRRVRERAAADDRSISQWIRRAVESELSRSTH